MTTEPFSIKPPRGTHDILPAESLTWQYLESVARLVIELAGYREIRIPIFEHTELFKRGVGETTDIVNKEMYTFSDKSERSLTLRPEGTAGVVRAYLNAGLHRSSPPTKLWYLGPMFRYEGTQTGRQRQFHQIGIEAFGSEGPLIDAEVVLVGLKYLKAIGLTNFQIQLNSIGCSSCRPTLRQRLKDKLAPRLKVLCDDCQVRFERNPLRMLDCKSKHCQAEYQDVPVSLDHLCSQCQAHWDGLVHILEGLGVNFVVNKRLVRGLDYYTRTVLEIVSLDPRLGAQSTICAGGRYDHLVETFGGQPTCAVGWALGLERLCLLVENSRVEPPITFVVSSQGQTALQIAIHLREAGLSAELDYPSRGTTARSFTKQLEQANKKASRWAVIAGEEEITSNLVTLKDMQTGAQRRMTLTELISVIRSS